MQRLRIKRTMARVVMLLVVMMFTAQTMWAWSGSGTSTDPYQITNASDLAQLATDVNGGNRYANKYFVQTADITALSTMATIGNSGNPFCGHYDGGGFTIYGLTKPLFGSIQKGETGYQQYTLSEVKNLTISGAEISTSVTGGTMGILARAIYNNVSITNCHVVSSSLVITGGSNAKCGGLIGSVEDDQSSQPLATVSGCSVTATSITNSISGQYCGGLFGVLTSRKNVDNNFVDATLTGDNKGGIAGYLSSTTAPSDYHDNYYHAATGLTAISSQTDNGETAVYKVTAGNNTTIVNSTSTGVFTYNGNKYFPEGETVSMTLSNTATGAPLGYQYNSYTASAGTLSGNATDGWTLTMPAADVLVSVDSPRSTGEAVAVSYIDENGIQQTAQAIALDGTETSLGHQSKETWYFVGLGSIYYTRAVSIAQNADVSLILCDNKTMNIGTSANPISNDDNNGVALGNYGYGNDLTIYGQTEGTGTLNANSSYCGIYLGLNGYYKQYGGRVTASGGRIGVSANEFTITRGTLSATATGTGSSYYGIRVDNVVNLNGGTVEASGNSKGIYSQIGSIILGGATVTASSYYAGHGVIIADGMTYSDGINHYTGTLTSDEVNAIAGKTISPLVTGECGASGDNLTWTYDQVSKTLTISGTGAMANYNYYSQPWNNFQNDIQNIVIGNGVTSIGDEAFYECSSLKSLTFASGSKLTTIGNEAFWGCNNTNFTTLVLPASVQSIGSYAFCTCSGLTTVTIGSGVTSIDRDAFYECSKVTDVYCYADPSALTWNENGCDDFKSFKGTRCHVADANAWSNFVGVVNVTFQGDLAPTATTSSVDGAYWSTYYNSAANMKADANTTVYKAAVNGSTVELTEIADKVINAGQAVVLRRSTEGAVSLTPQTAASTADYSENQLHGVDVRTATADIKATLGDGTFYVLSKKNDNFGFYQYTGAYMPARKAYLLLSGSNARSLTMTFEDETTAIRTTNYTNSDAWYTIDGRKLDKKPTAKGIYVNKGHKVVIK